MRIKHYANFPIPIPSNIPPSVVLAYVQTYVPTLRHNACVKGFEEIPTNPDQLQGDENFGPWDATVQAYQVHSVSQLAPGISRQAWWPVIFQCTPDGIRAKARNSNMNITVWATWTVRPRRQEGASPANSESTNSSVMVVGEEWELFDEILIEAHRLFMPFTSQYTRKLHHDITQSMVAEVTKGYLNGTLFQS